MYFVYAWDLQDPTKNFQKDLSKENPKSQEEFLLKMRPDEIGSEFHKHIGKWGKEKTIKWTENYICTLIVIGSHLRLISYLRRIYWRASMSYIEVDE